jgi:fructose-1,6-bisphosphatase/inositol monophosphatase family enzyme
MSSRFISTADLINAARDIIRDVHSTIRLSIQTRPEKVLAKMTTHHVGSKPKKALVIDKTAEETAIDKLEDLYREYIEVIGEESIGDFTDLSNVNRTCALLDMVDGSDLVELGVPLWCSAMIFFDPREPKILGALVGLPTDEIYYAYEGEPNRGLVYRSLLNVVDPMRGPAAIESLEEASICFYGQKAENFLCFKSRPDFEASLEALSSDSLFRIYNFAGNPIMVKLADRLKKQVKKKSENGVEIKTELPICRGFDAVVDIRGQYAHDAIPGLYIAKHAGAFLCELDGKEMTEDLLAQKLLKPTEKMTYIVASTQKLAIEITSLIKNVVIETAK